ncbi:MAG: clan AA aspartic protease, partial [Verrucomicrobia bacterium]|nr:clan AA aspartic protease [Verrucomicrobiota bacterium]
MVRRVPTRFLLFPCALLAALLLGGCAQNPAATSAAHHDNGDRRASWHQRSRSTLLAAVSSAATADLDAEESLALSNYFQAQNYSGITLRRGSGNHLEVRAKINDREGVFLIDTGAQITVVNRASLGKFNLSAVKTSVKVYGALGGPGEKIEAALASSIQLGPCTVSPFLLGVSDLGTLNSGRQHGRGEARFDGIIGADLLQNFSFVIDCRTPRLYAKDVRTPDGSSSAAEAAHPGLGSLLRGRDYVEVGMKKVAISDFEINANVNRRRAVLLVDTGAAITLFDRTLSQEAGI